MRIHVLTPGFTTPNGRAFLFPLKVWSRELRAAGYDLRYFTAEAAGLTDCDVLVVDSKFHKDLWQAHKPALLERFAGWAAATQLFYFDTGDSAGWINGDVVPLVHGYRKAQLLADRTAYLRPMYGLRAFTDYYHRRCGVADEQPAVQPPLAGAELLRRLGVSWNSGLADYSLHGPMRMALRQWIPLDALLRFPRPIARPAAPRPADVSCRFGVGYERASVAWQRRQIRSRMAGRVPTDKASRRQYMEELSRSQVVVSPFGLGEITLKDFEVFLTGGMLFKPDMTHMQTWPDLFVAGRTMATFSWDLDDFENALESCLADRAHCERIAEGGQRRYLRHTVGVDAARLFVEHFAAALKTGGVAAP